MRIVSFVLAAFIGMIADTRAYSQDADELAKQLSNPIASLISVPIQMNFDVGGGAQNHGFAYPRRRKSIISKVT